MSPALCQGHADLPECAEYDDELDCPGEPAGDEYEESSGMSTTLVPVALASHHMVGRQTRKKKTTNPTLHHPLPLTHRHHHLRPLLPLPIVASLLAHLVSSALSAPRTGILQWRSRLLRHGRGSQLFSALPTTRMMSPRSPRSGARQLASLVTSVESARSLADSRPKGARTGPASQFFFFPPSLHSILFSLSEI